MLSTAYEADELRKQPKAHLLQSYTEEGWLERVPSDLREIISLQQFAVRYLSHTISRTTASHSVSPFDKTCCNARRTSLFLTNRYRVSTSSMCHVAERRKMPLYSGPLRVGYVQQCHLCSSSASFIFYLDESHSKYIAG